MCIYFFIRQNYGNVWLNRHHPSFCFSNTKFPDKLFFIVSFHPFEAIRNFKMISHKLTLFKPNLTSISPNPYAGNF